MVSVIAWVLGIAALFSQGYELPKEFVDGALTRAEPKVERYWIGIEWICSPGPADQGVTVSEAIAEGLELDEVCYAGLEFGFDDAGGFVTGP
jgi:hypothetical protein